MRLLKHQEAWETFYSVTPPSPTKYSDNTRQTLSGNVYVANSFFGYYTTSSKGGAIYISNSNSIALVEETTFAKITSSSYAAAFFWIIQSLLCIIKYVDSCANQQQLL